MLRRLLLSLALLTASACDALGPGPSPTASPTPAPSLAVMMVTPDGNMGLARRNGHLLLMLSGQNGTLFEVTQSVDSPGQPTVHLATYGGQSGRAISSFVFGNAPPSAVKVEVTLEGSTASVMNGLYVIGLKSKDVLPALVHWRFLAADGSVISSGTGITD